MSDAAHRDSPALDIAALFVANHLELQRFLGRRGFTSDTASDLTQDAFLRVLTIREANRIRNPRAYLYRAVTNLGIDWRRKQGVMGTASEADDIAEVPDDAPSVERVIISRQEVAILAAAFQTIPRGPRQVFLARLDGLTFAQIEQRYGVRLQTAFSQVAKVTMVLRHALQTARTLPDAPTPTDS